MFSNIAVTYMKNNSQELMLPFLALSAGMEASATWICWSTSKEKVCPFQFLCLVTRSKHQEQPQISSLFWPRKRQKKPPQMHLSCQNVTLKASSVNQALKQIIRQLLLNVILLLVQKDLIQKRTVHLSRHLSSAKSSKMP